MRQFILAFIIFGLTSLAARGDDPNKEKIDALRKELAELRAKVAAKEAELAKLLPSTNLEWKQNSVGTIPKKDGYAFSILQLSRGYVTVCMLKPKGKDIGRGIEEPIFIVKMPTGGLKPLQELELDGVYKVVGDEILSIGGVYRVFDGRSAWVLEPVK
jgi:hypothetical protein